MGLIIRAYRIIQDAQVHSPSGPSAAERNAGLNNSLQSIPSYVQDEQTKPLRALSEIEADYCVFIETARYNTSKAHRKVKPG